MPSDNRREFDHVGNYNFRVELGGVTAAWFKAVSGLSAECEPIEFMDGDDKDKLIRKRPGRIKFGNITLKRGWSNKGNGELWDWWMKVQNNDVERKSGAIVLHNDKGDEVARYSFFEAWPIKWKGWDLEGKGTDVAIEELEICCEKIIRSTTGDASGGSTAGFQK